MGWDNRGYYYRARKINGRVVREYIGAGIAGALVARMDAEVSEVRKQERADERARREELARLDAPVEELNALADLLARAALQAAGFHQHKRGEWRKRRGRNKDATGEIPQSDYRG